MPNDACLLISVCDLQLLADQTLICPNVYFESRTSTAHHSLHFKKTLADYLSIQKTHFETVIHKLISEKNIDAEENSAFEGMIYYYYYY